MKTLRVADNNGVSEYEFNTVADATRERTTLISAYGYTRKNGFTRVNDGNTIYFNHAVYSTVKFEIV